MPVIDCSDLSKAFGNRPILSGVNLTVRTRERVGVVGNNGSGKTTLGRILAGIEEPDSGSVARRRGAKVEYLAQEPRLPAGRRVSDVVLESLAEWAQAKRRYEDLTEALSEPSAELERLVGEQAAAGEAVERLGGWERQHEAETIVGHLGIDDPTRNVDTLSGGERRRVAIARILVGAPDLAILDEPTNHLDIATIEWLEEFFVNRFSGALLLITHDRYVLDRVTTRTLEIDAGNLSSYAGGYGAYLEARAERQAMAERTEKNRQNFLRREVEWLRRQPKARATKQKARIGRAQTAIDASGPQREKIADLSLASERLGKTILELSGLRLERDGRTLVSGLDLALRQGERIGVVGANGTGKTSLLLALLGELEPSAGRIDLGTNTKPGYLDQARSGLDDDHSIRESVAGDQPTVEIGGNTLQVGGYLERFLFDHASQRTKVSVLSGGERARVCLARLLCQKTNLLLLDEPTNDLDVATLGALEAMLVDYGGSALIVCHDRWFLDRVATSILAFEGNGEVDLHRGTYSEYREKRDAERAAGAQRAASGKASGKGPNGGAAADAKPTAQPSKLKKLSYAEERELEGLFERIEAAEAEAERLAARLADPATYQDNRGSKGKQAASEGGVDVVALGRELEAARELAAALLVRWEGLEARKGA